jgi:hypothetical protein
MIWLLLVSALHAGNLVQVQVQVQEGHAAPKITGAGGPVVPDLAGTGRNGSTFWQAAVELPATVEGEAVPEADRADWRVSDKGSSRDAQEHMVRPEYPARPTVAAVVAGWVAVLGAIVAAVWIGRNERTERPVEVSPETRRSVAIRWILTVAAALGSSTLFTWPLMRDPVHVFASRGFDGSGMVWMGWYMARHFLADGLWSTVSGWPDAESLHGNDGWLYLLSATGLRGLGSGLGAQLWGWLGCAAAFVAAERLAARGFGARWPWSLAAGLVFSCNGVDAGSLAEGRFYQLAQWPLPLFLMAFLRIGEGPSKSRVPALLAGLAWLACLGTSAYTALLAVLGAAFLWAWRPDRRNVVRATWPMAVVCVPFAVLFAWLFFQSPRLENWVGSMPTLRNSATPGGLLGWSPGPSEEGGNGSPTLGFASLALALAAVRLVPRKTWLPLLCGSGLAILLALGPCFGVTALDDPVSTPWGWLARHWSPAGWFRFPVRFLLLANLALGTLAALALSNATGRWLRAVFSGALLVDALFWATPAEAWPRSFVLPDTGTLFRIAPGEGSMLHLLPQPMVRVNMEVLSLIHAACVGQIFHGRNLAEYCLAPTTNESPAFTLRRRIVPLLLEGEAEDAATELSSVGVGTVVLHPDLFTVFDAGRMGETLGEISVGRTAGVVGGEFLRVFALRDLPDEQPPMSAPRRRAMGSSGGGP